MTDSIFEKIYNEALLEELAERFGSFEQEHIEMTVSTGMMLRMIDKMNNRPRRGEVVMVVPTDGDGGPDHVWVHTKTFYPEGVYRLMTGGLEGDEAPYVAMLREVEEETGFKVKIDRCLAVITYTLFYDGARVPFVSYVFVTSPTQGTPQPVDSSEPISEFQAVPIARLADIARQLRSLTGRYADWGVFRAVAHELVWRQLG